MSRTVGTLRLSVVSPGLEGDSGSPTHYLVLAVKGQGEISIGTQDAGSGQIAVEEARDGIVELRDLDEVVLAFRNDFFMLI